MKLSTVIPSAAGLAVGYLLGAAAGRGRYRQITAAARSLITHPTVQQAAFDLAGQAKKYAHRVPGPAANLVDTTATRLQDTLTKPAVDSTETGSTETGSADTDGADTDGAATAAAPEAGPSAGPAPAPPTPPGSAPSA